MISYPGLGINVRVNHQVGLKVLLIQECVVYERFECNIHRFERIVLFFQNVWYYLLFC